MTDLSSGFDIPNPFGLLASDFGHDIDSYSAALKFLGDLASGVDEPRALETNGGSMPLLRSWERSGKFRKVLGKCRAAGAAEMALRARREAEAAQEPEVKANPFEQKFIPLEELPATHSVFTLRPSPGTGLGGS